MADEARRAARKENMAKAAKWVVDAPFTVKEALVYGFNMAAYALGNAVPSITGNIGNYGDIAGNLWAPVVLGAAEIADYFNNSFIMPYREEAMDERKKRKEEFKADKTAELGEAVETAKNSRETRINVLNNRLRANTITDTDYEEAVADANRTYKNEQLNALQSRGLYHGKKSVEQNLEEAAEANIGHYADPVAYRAIAGGVQATRILGMGSLLFNDAKLVYTLANLDQAGLEAPLAATAAVVGLAATNLLLGAAGVSFFNTARTAKMFSREYWTGLGTTIGEINNARRERKRRRTNPENETADEDD